MDDLDVGSDDACDQCGSHHFHIEDGRTFCENGHQQAGVHVAEDEADYGTQGKRIRKKDEKSKVKISKVFRGKKAFKLFLQAYQFILWTQCHALHHEKNLPAEHWNVVRDLWTLRLSKQLQRLEEPAEITEGGEDASSFALDSGEETEIDPESASTAPSEPFQKASDSPTLVQSIALCYMGILLLRLPVPLSSLFRWIREEDIVYLRAIRHVPADLKEKLPGEYHEALDTRFILTQERLHVAVLQLVKIYNVSFGMSPPSINWIPLLFEYGKCLALPLEVYKAVKNMNQIVSFDFKFDIARSRRRAISLPEAQLMALVIIAVKLIYPFDSDTIERYPRSLNEPGALRMAWEAWVNVQDAFENPGKGDTALRRGTEVEVMDKDIFNMSGKELDQYMDWYQRTWARADTASENESQSILDMFPLKSLPEKDDSANTEADREAAVQAKLHFIQSALRLRQPISDEEVAERGLEAARPGSHYAFFRSVKDLEAQPIAKAFYEAAAKMACLSLKTMVRAVAQTEQRITIWRNAERRAEKFGEELDLGSLGLGLVGDLEGEEETGSDMEMAG